MSLHNDPLPTASPAPIHADPGGREAVKAILVIVIFGNLVAVLFVGLFAPEYSRRAIGFVLTASVAALALWQIRTNQPDSGFRTLAYGGWVGMTFTVAINGGLSSPGTFVYPVLILIAGWVLGQRTILTLTVMTLMAELALVWATTRHWLPAQEPPPDAWIFFVHAIVIGIAASLAILIGRGFSFQLTTLAGRNEELFRQHELNNTLLDSLSRAGIGMVIVESGRIVNANRAMEHLFGYSEDDLRAMPSYLDITAPNSREEARRNFEGFLANDTTNSRFVGAVLTRNGEKREIEASLAAMPATGVPRTMVVLLDISERRAAFEAMRHSEERFSLIFDITPVAACITRLSDGTFLRINNAFKRGFGWNPEEVLGKTSIEIGMWPSICDRGPGTEMLRDAGRIFDHESLWHNKAGEERNVCFSSVIIDSAGEKCVLTMVHDITDIRRSEQRFSRIVNLSPVGIAVTRVADGRFMEVNPAYTRLHGWTREDVVGHTVYELGIASSPSMREAQISVLAARGNVDNVEHVWTNREGERRILQVSAGMIDFAGQPCVLTFMHDITEQRHAEVMLREIVKGTARATGGEFFRALVRHLARALDVPYALVSEMHPGDEARLHTLAFWASDQYAPAMTYDIADTPCDVVLGSEPRLVTEGLRQRFPSAELAQTLGLESYFGFPLRGVSGEPLGVLAIMDRRPLKPSEEHFTLMSIFAARAAAELERLRSEAVVSLSEQNFSRIFHRSPLAISISRFGDGCFVEVNEAYVQQLGWRRDELVGHNTVEMGMGPSEEQRRLWGLVLEKQTRITGEEVWLRGKDGRQRSVLLSTELIEFNGEKCVLAFLQDITERKNAEAQVRQINAELETRVRNRTAELTEANLELESFAYSVSHDLRAPLRGIDGFSRLLQEEYADRLDLRGGEYLQRVRRAAQRLGTLIDKLLDLSHVARHAMRCLDVDLSALVADVVDDLRQADAGRVVTIVIEPRCTTRGDPMLLRVVLENLMGNAWKYTRHNPAAQIEFGRETTAAGSCYFIRDNGVGFDMAYAGNLFAPFQRLHKASEFEGSGIGLASVARIVRRHGGRIWAEASPNVGAIFRFTLGGESDA